jgi:hypothetical protein
MLKDLLSSERKTIPQLAFHTMTLCDKIITIYGGMSEKNKISGDVYFLKLQNKSFIKSELSKNKQSKKV